MANALYNPALKQKALELYFSGVPLPQIALETGVPYGTIHGWHTREKWAGIRKQMRADILENWSTRFQAEALMKGHDAIIRIFDTSKALTEKIQGALGSGDLDSEALLRLAKALQAEATVVLKVFPFGGTEDQWTRGSQETRVPGIIDVGEVTRSSDCDETRVLGLP